MLANRLLGIATGAKLERDIATVADDFGTDLDQLFPQRGQRPVLYFLRYGKLLLRVTSGPTAGPPETSALGGKADEIRGKADVAAQRSAVGGRADVLAAWSGSPLVANSRSQQRAPESRILRNLVITPSQYPQKSHG